MTITCQEIFSFTYFTCKKTNKYDSRLP